MCVMFMISFVRILQIILLRKYNSEFIVSFIFAVYFLSFVCTSIVTNFLSTFTGAVVASLLALNLFNSKNRHSLGLRKI